MSLASKHKQWVLETVDRLRQRKARPDIERISRMVERFHGLTPAETKESLDKLCDEGVVLKVHFKGNVSFRHIKKPQVESNDPSTQKYDTSSRILSAVNAIMKQTGDGVGFEDLEQWLISKDPDTRLVKFRLTIALQREIENGSITKLMDDCYVLTESLPKEKKIQERPTCQLKPVKKDVKPKQVVKPSQAIEASQVEKETSTVQSSATKENVQTAKEIVQSNEVKETARRGRPLSKRKKFKKTHGPDFENPLELKKLSSKDKQEEKEEVEDKCGFCSLTAQTNPEGKEEPLLICIECKVKAHPSCMDYSPALALRALNSPWQCMDCKVCTICDGAENADLMLFCDACDKGYHMICHQPPLTNKPKGKWVCFVCKKDVNKGATTEQKADSSDKEENSRRRGRKRKVSSPPSPKSTKTQKSDQPSEDGIKSENNEPAVGDFTGDTNGMACLLTPSASPRPSDTFDYEMKMSLSGLSFPPTEDNTTYSDASDWNMHDVTRFFEDCGFKEEAKAFADQEIDGKSLLLMRRDDVLSGLGVKLGPAVKIYRKIVRLQQYSQAMLYS